jgi:hypothetical protein
MTEATQLCDSNEGSPNYRKLIIDNEIWLQPPVWLAAWQREIICLLHQMPA